MKNAIDLETSCTIPTPFGEQTYDVRIVSVIKALPNGRQLYIVDNALLNAAGGLEANDMVCLRHKEGPGSPSDEPFKTAAEYLACMATGKP